MSHSPPAVKRCMNDPTVGDVSNTLGWQGCRNMTVFGSCTAPCAANAFPSPQPPTATCGQSMLWDVNGRCKREFKNPP